MYYIELDVNSINVHLVHFQWLSIFQAAGMDQAGPSNQLEDHGNPPGCLVSDEDRPTAQNEVSNQIVDHVNDPSACLVNDEDTALSAVMDTTPSTVPNQVHVHYICYS